VVALPDEHRSWQAAELQRATGHAIEAGVGSWHEQLQWLVQSDALPVACGSLYLVAELLPLLNATD